MTPTVLLKPLPHTETVHLSSRDSDDDPLPAIVRRSLRHIYKEQDEAVIDDDDWLFNNSYHCSTNYSAFQKLRP